MKRTSTKSLTERADSFLIKQVKEHANSEAFDEISRRYGGLFYKQCHKYSAALSSCGIFMQDIFNEKNITLLNCIKSFDPKKGAKLSSWIGNHARYLCLNEMNERKGTLPSSDDEIKNRIEEQQMFQKYFETSESLEESKERIFELLNQIKDKRVKEVFEYRYSTAKKMIWQVIAKKMSTSPQTVMSLHKKGISIIKNKIRNEELVCQ